VDRTSAAREAGLLPVACFHVVFTLPAAVADIAYRNKAGIYDILFTILFTASAETMVTIAAGRGRTSSKSSGSIPAATVPLTDDNGVPTRYRTIRTADSNVRFWRASTPRT
jgi:hypothetical protein